MIYLQFTIDYVVCFKIDPSRGLAWAHIPRSGKAEVDGAVAAAKTAFPRFADSF